MEFSFLFSKSARNELITTFDTSLATSPVNGIERCDKSLNKTLVETLLETFVETLLETFVETLLETFVETFFETSVVTFVTS